MLKSINISELKKIQSDIILIDIRSVQKYNDNHINNAINIPKQVLLKYYFKYLDKNKRYYIYCEHGKSSANLCFFLTKLGYNVYNVNGGYESWILNS